MSPITIAFAAICATLQNARIQNHGPAFTVQLGPNSAAGRDFSIEVTENRDGTVHVSDGENLCDYYGQGRCACEDIHFAVVSNGCNLREHEASIDCSPELAGFAVLNLLRANMIVMRDRLKLMQVAVWA